MNAFARATDPQTSHDAARTVDVTLREAQALKGLSMLGGSGTSRQVAEVVGVDKWSISPRFKPLEAKGRVRRTDERHQGQIVWALTPQ